MIDSQTTIPIQCKRCGFTFKFAGAGEQCAIECPVCGFENSITHCHHDSCTEITDTLLQDAPNGDAVHDEIYKCRAKNCPKLNHACCGGCSPTTILEEKPKASATKPKLFSPVSAIFQHYSEKNRRLILFSTICVQIFVLIGVLAYVLLDYQKSDTTDQPLNQIARNEQSPYALPAAPVTPATAPPVTPTQVTSAPVKSTSPSTSPVKEAISPNTQNSQNSPNTPSPTLPPALPQVKKPNENTGNSPFSQVTTQLPPTNPSPSPVVVADKPAEKTAAKIETVQKTNNLAEKPEENKKELAKTETVQPKIENPSDYFIPTSLKPMGITTNQMESGIPNTATNAIPLMASQEKTHFSEAAKTSEPQIELEIEPGMMLEKSIAYLASDPERSLHDALNAVKKFEQLGQSLPSTAYWILGQAYASLSWGKMFLINLPPVENMVISSDSRWILTQRQDNSVWIWDIYRDQNSRSGVMLDSGKVPYIKLAFSPDLRLIIGGRSDGMIMVWNIAQQNAPETPVPLREKISGLRDLQISPDGCWLAAFGGAPRSSIIAARNHRYIHSIDSPYPVDNAFLGNRKIFHSLNEQLPPYQIVQLRSMIQVPGQIENAKISNEIPLEIPGKAILLGSSFPLRKNVQASYLSENTALPQNLEMEPLSIKVAVAMENMTTLSEPNAVWLWDLRQIHNGFIPPPMILRGHEEEIHTMQFSPDSSKLAVGGKNAVTLIYDLQDNKTEKIPFALYGHRLDITTIAFSPDSSWIATGSRDNTIRLWNLSDLKLNQTPASVVLDGHLGWISSLIIDDTGTKIFSGSYDKTIRIWNVDPNNIVSTAQKSPVILQSNQSVVRELMLSPDRKKLISLGGDGSLRIRNIKDSIDDQRSLTFRNKTLPISNIAVTPNNRWLVFSYINQRNPSNSGVRFWPLDINHLLQLVSE